jgi:hypothetical protein
MNCHEELVDPTVAPASGLAIGAAEVIMSDEDARHPAHETLTVDAVTGEHGGNADPQALLGMMRRLRARERGHLASLLHDGPIQELAAAALEVDLQRGASGEPDGLARQVHAASHTLRHLQDELWPFPRPGSGLVETLKQRTAWLLATPLAVAVGEGAPQLPEADIQALADVTELILVGLDEVGLGNVGLGNAEAWDRPIVAVRADPDLIFLELNMTPAPGHDPASAGSAAFAGSAASAGSAFKAWLHRLAAATGAQVEVALDDRRLRVWMRLPRCPDHRPGA